MALLTSVNVPITTSRSSLRRSSSTVPSNSRPRLSARRTSWRNWKVYFLSYPVAQRTKPYPLLPGTGCNHYRWNADRSVHAVSRTDVPFLRCSDVRLAPKNYAFIEYEDEFKAGNALSGLNETQIGTVTLKLSYAKKWCCKMWNLLIWMNLHHKRKISLVMDASSYLFGPRFSTYFLITAWKKAREELGVGLKELHPW